MEWTKWLIGGGVYTLGALGMFLSRFMELRHLGSPDKALGEAAMAALIWPIEIVRLLL